MEDPAEAEGSDDVKRRAFDHAFVVLARRIDLLLALPLGKLSGSRSRARSVRLGSVMV